MMNHTQLLLQASGGRKPPDSFEAAEIRRTMTAKSEVTRFSILLQILISLLVINLIGLDVCADDSSTKTAWKAGIAKTVITPETPVWLAGYGSKRVPDGKLHDLWMKALALESADGHRAV